MSVRHHTSQSAVSLCLHRGRDGQRSELCRSEEEKGECKPYASYEGVCVSKCVVRTLGGSIGIGMPKSA